jgi:predicted TIM-barrel fold metal-dependent hydrolase
MTIDAYAHCGISKYLPLPDVLAVMEQAGVEGTVLCQHLGEYDNRYLANVVSQDRNRFAAVCLVDPDQPNAVEELRKWNATSCFRGVRLVGEWLKRNPRLCLEAIDLGMNLVVFTPEGIAGSMPDIRNLVRQRPHAKIILSHFGNPKVENGAVVAGSEILELAAEPAVYVQVSGFGMFSEYPYTALTQLITDIVTRFGPERLTWGSNFPVCGDWQAYCRDLALVRSGAWGLSAEGIDRLVGATAQRLWFD